MAFTPLLFEGFETGGLERFASVDAGYSISTTVRAEANGAYSLAGDGSGITTAVIDVYEYQGTANGNAKGFGCWLNAGTTGVGTVSFVNFRDASNNSKVNLQFNAAGGIDVRDSSSFVIYGGSFGYNDGNWHYVEFWYEEGTNASAELFVNGVSRGSCTGANFLTGNTDNLYFNAGRDDLLIDDLYFGEATATSDLLGGMDIFATVGDGSATTGGDTLSAGSWANVQEIPKNDTNLASYNYTPGSATERLEPDATADTGIEAMTGSVTDIQADPDTKSGSWTAAANLRATSNNVSVAAMFSMPSPAANLTTVADDQEFRVLLRPYDSAQTGDPTWRIELWEFEASTWSLVRAGTDTTILNDAGDTVVSFTWNGNELTTISGANVGIKVVGTKSGGSPGARNTIDIGAIEWNATRIAASAAESGWIEADSGTKAGPSGVTGLDDIVGMTTFVRTQYSGSGSTLTHSLYRGNDVDGVTLLSLGNATVSLADFFDVTNSASIVPLTTEHSRAGFGHPASVDVDIDCTEVITMVAHVPVIARVVTGLTESIAVTESAATVTTNVPRTVTCTTESIAVTESAATVAKNVPLTVTCNTESIAVTETSATAFTDLKMHFYFDASDAAAVGTNWTSPASTFGEFFSTGGYISEPNANTLSAAGTSAQHTADPGTTINSVRFRTRVTVPAAFSDCEIEVFKDGGTESLGSQTTGSPISPTAFTTWTTLTAPTGGWTWAQLQALEVVITPTYDTGIGDLRVWGVELEVSMGIFATEQITRYYNGTALGTNWVNASNVTDGSDTTYGYILDPNIDWLQATGTDVTLGDLTGAKAIVRVEGRFKGTNLNFADSEVWFEDRFDVGIPLLEQSAVGLSAQWTDWEELGPGTSASEDHYEGGWNWTKLSNLEMRAGPQTSDASGDLRVYRVELRITRLAVADRTVTCTTESVAVTENAATVTTSVPRTVSCTTESIAVTESAATVNRARDVNQTELTAEFTDTFTDTDGTELDLHTPDLGSSWVQIQGTTKAQINNNQLSPQASTADEWVVSSGVSDGLIRLTSKVGVFQDSVSIIFRSVDDVDSNDHWLFAVDDYDFTLYRFSTGGAGFGSWGPTALYTTNIGRTLELEVHLSGSSIKCYVDGVEIFDVTDTEHQSGTYHGFRTFGNTNNWADDYYVYSGKDNRTLVGEKPAAINRARVVGCTSESIAVTENAATVSTGAVRVVDCTSESVAVLMGLVTDEWYSDASLIGPVDYGTWTDDANAFDGLLTTSAYTEIPSSVTAGYLTGVGVPAPATGPTIKQVHFTLYGSYDGVGSGVTGFALYSNGIQIGLPSAVNTSSPSWGTRRTVTQSGYGDWTWPHVGNLQTRFYATEDTSLTRGDAYYARIEVEHRRGSTVNRARTIGCTTESIAVTENAATVNSTRDVTAGTESIAVTENAGTVTTNVPLTVTCTSESIAVTETPATITTNVARTVTCTTESIAVTENAATVGTNAPRVVTCTPESIVVTETPATIFTNVPLIVTGVTESIAVKMGLVIDEYYIDANVIAPIDSSGNWTDDANAFDGRADTSAYTSVPSSLSTGYLTGAGVNSPASGPTIEGVYWTLYGSYDGVGNGVTGLGVYSNGLQLGIASAVNTSSPSWGTRRYSNQSGYGDWTWNDAGNLLARFYATEDTSLTRADAFYARIEIEHRRGSTVTKNVARVVGCTTESIAVTESAATVNSTRDVTTGTESIAVTEGVAQIFRGANRDVSCSPESIAVIESAAIVDTTDNRDVTGVTETVVVTENQATAATSRIVSAGIESIAVTENAATVDTGVIVTRRIFIIT